MAAAKTRDRVSISSTLYKQLLHAQIPKTQKDTDNLTEIFTHNEFGRTGFTKKTVAKFTRKHNLVT